MPITHKVDGKFETVYIKGAVAYYASVQEPKDKYKSDEKEYTITLFVPQKDATILEEKVLMNKSILEVGLGKTKLKKVKYPTSDQVEEGKPNYDAVKGLFGLTVTSPTVTKQGKPITITVADANGEITDELVGNGSVVDVKLIGWKSQDGLLNTRLQIVKVNELVPYSGGAGGGIVDDELGLNIKSPAKKVVDEFEDDIPFDTGDENDDVY